MTQPASPSPFSRLPPSQNGTNDKSFDSDIEILLDEPDEFDLFARALKRVKRGDVDVLDEESGLPGVWAKVCEARYEKREDELILSEDAEHWALERNTWQLVQVLYTERMSEPPRAIDDSTRQPNPYALPVSVVQKAIERDRDFIELSLLRDWLHSIPSSLNPAEVNRSYWPYTKNKIKESIRSAKPLPPGLVKHLDPDAPIREGRLDPGDASYEKALIRSLFEYVRAGDIDAAIDMCRQSSMDWRAASLGGGKLWWDPSLAKGTLNSEEDFEMSELEHLIQTEKRAKGNVRRRLWKATCRKMASTPTIDQYEKALYGAISGDVDSVLPVCSTWEDHVWANVNALFEDRVEKALLRSKDGSYWNKLDPPRADAGMDVDDQSGVSELGIKESLQEIFDGLLASKREDLRLSARDPFHVAQAWIVRGKINDLLSHYVQRLDRNIEDAASPFLAHLHRFFAHLVLFLRQLNLPLPEHAANRILQAYVQVLEATGKDNLVAFYASHLEQGDAIEAYAQYLYSLPSYTDRAGRKAALLRTVQEGLDLAQVAVRTTELTLSDKFLELEEFANASFLDVPIKTNAKQKEMIRSVEWLSFDKATYPFALAQSNALLRYFMSSGMPFAARELLQELPRDLLSTCAGLAESENDLISIQIREHLDFNGYWDAISIHSKWVEVWSARPSDSASPLEKKNFADGIAMLTEEIYQVATDLLKGDWLKHGEPEEEGLEGQRRKAELERIREIYVPELVFRLHSVLFETRDVISGNLAKALDLSNIIADERYKIYVDFIGKEGNRLPDYLTLVREATLAAMEKNPDPFGRLP